VRYVEEQIPRVVRETLNLGQREEPLVRELAHSLNTPMARMEATLLARTGDRLEPEAQADLLAGIEVCKSFLAAFRQLATLAHDTYAWEPRSIRDLLVSASRLYSAPNGDRVTCDITVPDGIPGYGKNYLIAVVLPLLENALEASPPDGKVSVAVRFTGSACLLDVANDLPPGTELSPDMFEQAWTSKPGHEGLGLATVNNLLATHDGAELSYSVDTTNRVTFTVRLPRRQA
jgi:signal transduction histidine kinase